MSRRKPNPEMSAMTDGIVQLWCPSHHNIGMIVAHPSNRTRFVRGGGVFISEPDATKLRVRCVACEEAGKHLDLQASWERITKLVLANMDDTKRWAEDVTLGGQAGA